MKQLLIAICLFASTLYVYSQQEVIELPTPIKTGGKPLIEALSQRQTNRNFADKSLDKQTLSNLLWAAYGFNREDKRTVASSQNRQEIDVYVMFKDGIYFYDAKLNNLKLRAKGDYREGLGGQKFAHNAAFNLIYVSNLDEASSREAGFIDTGLIVQNVYLFCASEDLGTVVRGSFNKELLSQYLKLTDKQEIITTQTVGYKK